MVLHAGRAVARLGQSRQQDARGGAGVAGDRLLKPGQLLGAQAAQEAASKPASADSSRRSTMTRSTITARATTEHKSSR
jgi:hypothetical protein